MTQMPGERSRPGGGWTPSSRPASCGTDGFAEVLDDSGGRFGGGEMSAGVMAAEEHEIVVVTDGVAMSQDVRDVGSEVADPGGYSDDRVAVVGRMPGMQRHL